MKIFKSVRKIFFDAGNIFTEDVKFSSMKNSKTTVAIFDEFWYNIRAIRVCLVNARSLG